MEETEARVREARPDDAMRLSRMRYEFRAAEDRAVEDREAFLDRCRSWMRARLDPGERGWRCWVTEAEGRIVGHVWLRQVPKVPNPVREAETHAYLTNTYVEPGLRGRGLGSALVEVAVDGCRKVGVDSVILWPTDASRPLYRRIGFEPAGDDLFELRLDAGS